jgi:hypothetical protein
MEYNTARRVLETMTDERWFAICDDSPYVQHGIAAAEAYATLMNSGE